MSILAVFVLAIQYNLKMEQRKLGGVLKSMLTLNEAIIDVKEG